MHTLKRKKEQIISDVIDLEGGYVNSTHDSGGATKYGITEGVARGYGYIGDMREFPSDLAERIYEDLYWSPLNLDGVIYLSEKICEEIFDIGVNMGIGRSAEFFQRSLNVLNSDEELYSDVQVDRIVGTVTIDALGEYLSVRDECVFVTALKSLRGAFYIELCEKRHKDQMFLYGWLKNRV